MASTEPRAVFGSFGHGNLGDELVPDCFNTLLQSIGQPGDLPAMARYDAPLELPHILDMSQGRDWMVNNPGARVFLVGGGIVAPKPISCHNRAFEIKSADAQYQIFAASIEPGVPYRFGDRRALARHLDHTGPVTVRDEMSAKVLSKLFASHPVQVVGDIGLWTQASDVPQSVAAMAAEPGICVTLHTTWEAADVLPWIVPELVTLARDQKVPVTVLPFSPFKDPDITIHQQLAAALRDAAPDLTVNTPAEMIRADELTHGVAAAFMKAAKLVVSTRLHGCVVACSQRTPYVALAYHPKLAGFAQASNRPSSLLPTHPPANQKKGIYGYSFSDLGLGAGDLVARAEVVMADDDFSVIGFYRRRQQIALAEMLGLGRDAVAG